MVKTDLLKIFSNPVCIHCGSFLTTRYFYCRSCLKKEFFPRFRKQKIALSTNIEGITFLRWRPGESDSLSRLVYLAKTRESRFFWKMITKEMAKTLSSTLTSEREATIVAPVPSLKHKPWHTQYLSKFFAEQAGLEHYNLLTKKNSSTPQKELQRAARANAGFEICTKTKTLVCGVKHIILVDDVITTGSSLLNCTHALRQAWDRDIEVTAVVLFEREK